MNFHDQINIDQKFDVKYQRQKLIYDFSFNDLFSFFFVIKSPKFQKNVLFKSQKNTNIGLNFMFFFVLFLIYNIPKFYIKFLCNKKKLQKNP